MTLAALALPVLAYPADRVAGGRYDSVIAAEVNKKLHDDAQLRDVRAAVDDGVVTLSGGVSRYLYKEKAEKKVSKIKNVAGVRNLIAVQTESVSDAELFNRLARKLAYDRSNRGNVFNYLTLQVRNGVATLGGQVRDDLARDSARDIVQNEKGVRGMVDHIQVSHVSIFDDGAPIRIVVDHGHVALYGVVANRMESQVAEIRAREVPGAFSVENHLIVARDIPR